MQLLLKANKVREVTRNQMIDFELPEDTISYTPVSNELIIETALEALDKEGFKLVDEFYKHSVGKKFVGGFILDGSDLNIGYNFEFAFKNSYDKSMSIGLALGTSTFICSNSSVNGEYTLKRVHTGNADKVVEEYITETVKELRETYDKMTKEFEFWKSIDVSKRLCAETVGRLYIEDKVLSPRQLSVVRDELNLESYNYGVENTAYNLYQACTHALKSEPPLTFIQTHAQLHDFFTKNFN